MNGRCGTRQMVHLIAFYPDRLRYIVANEIEARMCEQLLYISLGTSKKIINSNNLMSLF
jgi:hypothetical protein